MEAYKNCTPSKPEKSLRELITNPVSEWKDLIVNDFEKNIFLSHPQLNSIKKSLYSSGAIFSSMSGSGSTVYGIFSEKPVISGNLRKYVIYEGSLQSILTPAK
jgi:4-diphosphocytidyl-2-C-methyl-D-erythritol kinase